VERGWRPREEGSDGPAAERRGNDIFLEIRLND